MKKGIKRTLVAVMTMAMMISSLGTISTKVEAAANGYVLQDKTVQDLMKEYGVIAFNKGVIKVHFHSNYMVNELTMNANSGLRTAYNVTENFYFKSASELNANMSEYTGANTDVLYTGAEVSKSNNENKVKLANGNWFKIDRPTTVISDKEIRSAGYYTQFVDLNDVKRKFVTYNKNIAAQGNKGNVEVSITGDQNNRYIKVGSGENYRNMSYADFAKYASNEIIFDFANYNNNDTLVLNIDMKNQKDASFAGLILRENGSRVSNNEDNFNKKYNRVYFNFYDSSKADKQYTGTITFTGRGFGTIIAPSASINLPQNWDGMVVANNLEVGGQFHRINGTSIPYVATSNEAPTTEQPTTQKPSTEQPTTEQPTTQKPSTEQPTTEKPTTEQPTTEKPNDNKTESNTPGSATTEADNPSDEESASQDKTDLTITVKDEETDEPVPGATVEITTPDGEKTQHVTDEDGNVTVTDVPEGDYKVVIKDVPEEYNVTTGTEVNVKVNKGKATKKTVTKAKNTAYSRQVKKDAKNASKAMKWAADIKTGDGTYAQAINTKEIEINQFGAKNNKSISKKHNKSLKKFKKKYKKQSKEVAGWITIAGTKIDYPVMYTGLKNNDKYLQKNIKGEKDTHGMLFASYMTPKRKITYNSVIYGHNMKDGTMFTDLTKYANKSFYKNHKYVKFSTQSYNYVYEVVEVIRVSCKKGSKDRMIYQKFGDLKNKKTFKKWQKQVAKNREYKCSGKYKCTDKLLMLSTCEYEKENGRFAVICKQVKCAKVKK